MSSATITVGLPLCPGGTLFDLAGAIQIFAYAIDFEATEIAADQDPIPTTEGVSVMPNATVDDRPLVDIL